MLAFSLAGTGLTGIRIVFGHLVLVALVTWILRRKMAGSEVWTHARGDRAQLSAGRLRQLLRPKMLRALGVRLRRAHAGQRPAGTFGFFLPYILKTMGGPGQAASVGLNALNFVLIAVGVLALVMPLVDPVNRAVVRDRRPVLGVFPVTNAAAIAVFVLVNALASSCGQQQFHRLWCQELFPTMLCSTAQGAIIFAQKLLLAGWSVVVPVIASRSFLTFAWILAIATFGSVVIGTVRMPRPAGSLARVGLPAQ